MASSVTSRSMLIQKRNDGMYDILQARLFAVLHHLAKNTDQNKYLVWIIFVIEWAQLFSFPLDYFIFPEWPEEQLGVIPEILEATRMTFLLRGMAWSSYVIFFYVVVVLLLGVIFDFIMTSFAITIGSPEFFRQGWAIKMLKASCKLISTLFFIPCIAIVAYMLRCESVEGFSGYRHVLNKEHSYVVCWQGIHIVHSIIALITILSVIFLVVLFVSTHFDRRLQSKNVFARFHSRLDILYAIVKGFLALLFDLWLPSWSKNTLIGCVIVSYLSLSWFSLHCLPFYNKKVKK